MAKGAKSKKQGTEKSLETTLWDSANKLRGSMEAGEYKHVVLGLIFLKYAGDKFDERKNELIADGKGKYVEMLQFYTSKNVFYLPLESRWSYVMENSKQSDIVLKVDSALSMIEKNNPVLKGALPDNYYSRMNLDVSKFSALLDIINSISVIGDSENDVIGRVYEYFLGKFALSEGKKKGEYYTPKCVVKLITEMIEPYLGKIYDPCCGSGGLFVQSKKFVESHHGNTKDISIYGQENTATTYKLAKMNLAIRGISANLGNPADSFKADQHPDLKADFIMANPPFNQKDWREEKELIDDPRWSNYGVPATGNANYGWILHMLSKLSQNGVAGFLLANGALSGEGTEYKIRKQLIENDVVEAILILPQNLFYTTDISVTLWILNKNKKERSAEQNGKTVHFRNRQNKILFIDLRPFGVPLEKKYIQLSDQELAKISSTYHNWQRENTGETYADVAEYCKSVDFEQIREKDYTLVPSNYIEFIKKIDISDFDADMQHLQCELSELLENDVKSKEELHKVMKDLGYDL